ncbi:acyl-CoA thioesterase YciA [Sphingobium sp. B7D2B]|uniref:acyl-CoA thioesterase n=1 Tax=Sphingobium sp. B7D2B TaxID=2940583 RepID=UPI002224CEBD|nr:acyl-CoA thioesterase [Sphingobium sp. B7D2B]MCW2364954.1 acyl-CoA thioesterase YciA [Sphingobium sp. B7D2B]
MAADEDVLPEGAPATRITAMPADANPYGDIFGGWLMGQMDMAAALVASRHSKGRAVTIAVEGMQFHRPVLVGDEVSVFATLVKVGSTSMTIEVEAWRRARHSEETYKVTQARFIFVAIDEVRRPRRVPPMVAEA